MDPSQGEDGNRGQKRDRSRNDGDDTDEESKEAPQPQRPRPPHHPHAMLPIQNPLAQASSTAPFDLANPLVRQILQLQNADPTRNHSLFQSSRTNLNPHPNQNLLPNLNLQPQQQFGQQISNLLGGVPGRPTVPNSMQGRGGVGDAELIRTILSSGGDNPLQNLLPQQPQHLQQQQPQQGNLQALLLQLQAQQAQQQQQQQQPQQSNTPQALLLQLQQSQQQQNPQQGNFPQAQAALRQLQAFELQRQLSTGIAASTTSAAMPQNPNNQLAAMVAAALAGGAASLPQQIELPPAASLSTSRPYINPPDTADSTPRSPHGLASTVASPAAAMPGPGRDESVDSPRASAPSAGNNEGITGRPPRVMYNETDEGRLTPYQCLARKHLEYFEADQGKVEEGAQGRNKAIVLGQVGIRCRFCSHLKRKEKAPAAAFYPSKLSGIYQSAQNIINSHLAKDCKNVPEDVREELLRLGNRKSAPGGGKAYWADEATQVGVIEDEGGLRFAQAPLSSAVASAAAAEPAMGVDR